MVKKGKHIIYSKSTGFTIVELLIVVVVIAILAAITIVSYNGITQKAKASVAQNAISQAKKKLALYAVDHNAFPGTLEELDLASSGDVIYQYTENNATDPKGYCVTVTAGGISYRLGENFSYTAGSSTSTINQSTPTNEVCPGHSETGVAITNYSTNPGAEVDAVGFSGPNSSTVARSTVRAHSGTASVVVTMPQTPGYTVVGGTIISYSNFTTVLEPNTTYTLSAWVWVPSSTVEVVLAIQGTGRLGTPVNPDERESGTIKNQWVRVHNTFTTATAGSITSSVLNAYPTTVANTQFWVDDVMLVKGSSPANFADGDTEDWVWNGATGKSTSQGPAV
jgi:prepilin-type N-terminal cleavage/methylation domain